MAIRTDFTAGEVLAAADLNDTFGAKLDLAGGKILQIVRATDATARATTSTSFVDADLSVTITPQKSTSAILLIATGFISAVWTVDAQANRGALQITDNSDYEISGALLLRYGALNISGSGTRTLYSPYNILAYSTPATISATTYKLRFRTDNAGCTINLNNSESTGQMFAIEVSA
jgi:hypothetical protein